MAKNEAPSLARITEVLTQVRKKHFGVKLLFAVVILWQLPQTIIAVKYGEPYPALIMPGFSGTMTDQDGNIHMGNVKCKIVFTGGSVRWISMHELLAQAPDSNRGPIMVHMFSPPPAAPEHRSMNTLKARLFPGRALSHLRSTQSELDTQTKDWLKARIGTLFPAQELKAVSFVWYEQVFNVNRLSMATSQDPSGIREVRF